MIDSFIQRIKYVFKCILNLIYYDDGRCIICRKDCEGTQLLCRKCSKKIMLCKKVRVIQEGKISINCYSSSYYYSVVKQLVKKMKYKSDFRSCQLLGNIMYETIKENNMDFDVMTYIPMTHKDLRKRTFNQSKALCTKIISNNDNYKFKCVKLLKKNRNTKDQIGLTKLERWENLKNCFEFCGKREFIQGKRILLIDDVLTTGATIYYCSKILIENGAESVVALTAAAGTKR